MKIVHLCLGNFFSDNYSYQENMLSKFHKQMGYDIEVVASLFTFDQNGKGIYRKETSTYFNENNVLITRLAYKNPFKVYRKLKRYVGAYTALEKAAPDILFIHGCQFMDMDIVVKYLSVHKNVKVYVDNHADFSNSATNILSKNILHRIVWRHAAKIIEPYTEKFYGVLPARVDFLKNMYHLPAEKVELLVMGADDDKIFEAKEGRAREVIRGKYGIKPDEFLVMTGGKIDEWKTQTLLLMKAVGKIQNEKIKLIVFGSVIPELIQKVNELADGKKVQYIGWIASDLSYNYWSAADLAVFPGRHSVFWEQVAGMGIPMICKYWDGTTHIDVGGNVIFLKQDSVEEIQSILQYLLANPGEYQKMLDVACGKGKEKFSYKEISRKAIQME